MNIIRRKRKRLEFGVTQTVCKIFREKSCQTHESHFDKVLIPVSKKTEKRVKKIRKIKSRKVKNKIDGVFDFEYKTKKKAATVDDVEEEIINDKFERKMQKASIVGIKSNKARVGLKVKILGDPKISNIIISKYKISCDCYDYKFRNKSSKHQCVHIYFLFKKILILPLFLIENHLIKNKLVFENNLNKRIFKFTENRKKFKKENDICFYCSNELEDFETSKNLIRCVKCNEVNHRDCFIQWSRVSNHVCHNCSNKTWLL